MADKIWTTQSPMPGDSATFSDVTITCRQTSPAVLVSGDLGAAINALAPGCPLLGLLEQRPDAGAFALAIAQDRALLCTPTPLTVSGWQAGFAVSAADDLYLEIRVNGAQSENLRLANMQADTVSRSCAVLFAGVTVLLAGAREGYVILAERPQTAAVCNRLTLRAKAL